jgi:hypothetical protein
VSRKSQYRTRFRCFVILALVERWKPSETNEKSSVKIVNIWSYHRPIAFVALVEFENEVLNIVFGASVWVFCGDAWRWILWDISLSACTRSLFLLGLLTLDGLVTLMVFFGPPTKFWRFLKRDAFVAISWEPPIKVCRFPQGFKGLWPPSRVP